MIDFHENASELSNRTYIVPSIPKLKLTKSKKLNISEDLQYPKTSRCAAVKILVFAAMNIFLKKNKHLFLDYIFLNDCLSLLPLLWNKLKPIKGCMQCHSNWRYQSTIVNIKSISLAWWPSIRGKNKNYFFSFAMKMSPLSWIIKLRQNWVPLLWNKSEQIKGFI